ncbi:MAG: DUF2282 domain-containing protein [Alphaproteobacteria bacterium]|nr:DUF2282 domain-containing protein [Alphaproteobacteria bacterium]
MSKAGENDCFTAGNFCGGTQEVDNDPAFWKYVPADSCRELGRSLSAKDG